LIIHDALYGTFELPPFLEGLVMAPEFRRLSEVRLININSASLSALADVRRYSHTLGAIRLAMANPLVNFGAEELRALFASMIVHDAGTPAFAHLFEYFLTDRYKKNHESVVSLLLKSKHHPDGRAHQIYASKIPQFESLCKKSKIDFQIVMQILEGNHPGSKLVFGSVDFDNIDNVARMNFMLGKRFDLGALVELAGALGVDTNSQLLISKSQQKNVELWATLRRNAYDVLVFDAPTVAGQAVLSAAISDALADGTLSEVDWFYTDTELVKTIRENSIKGKIKLERDFFGTLPEMKILLQVFDTGHPIMNIPRDTISALIEQFLVEHLNTKHPYGYSLRDRGTFEKRIEATDPDSGLLWSTGERSDSLVLYGFGKGGKKVYSPEKIGREFIQWAEKTLC
jgi:HD superfamily phosphohydrolase